MLHESETLEALGTALSLEDVTEHELLHRVAIGWRKFWAMKKLLLNKGYPSHADSSSWTPRATELRRLRTAQYHMLRRICGYKRRPEELWHEWICRTTRHACEKANRSAYATGSRHTHAENGLGQGTLGGWQGVRGSGALLPGETQTGHRSPDRMSAGSRDHRRDDE